MISDSISGISPLGSTTATAVTGNVSPAGAVSVQATAPISQDFGAILQQMTTDAIATMRNGEALSVAGVKGQASVQDVVEGVMAAEQTLQATMTIRDKVVAAYLEISRMTI
jgi:flagellar hook-basal body complex protein FliE